MTETMKKKITGALLPEQILTCLPRLNTQANTATYLHKGFGGYSLTMSCPQNSLPHGSFVRLLLAYVNGKALARESRFFEIGTESEILRSFGIFSDRIYKKKILSDLELLSQTRFTYQCRNETLYPKDGIIFKIGENGLAEMDAGYFERLCERHVATELTSLTHLMRNTLAMDMFAWLKLETAMLSLTTEKEEFFSFVRLQEMFNYFDFSFLDLLPVFRNNIAIPNDDSGTLGLFRQTFFKAMHSVYSVFPAALVCVKEKSDHTGIIVRAKPEPEAE
jgi:hypothetical protein